VKPIELTLTLPAARRPTGSADVHELNKKLKETVTKVETLETKFSSTLEKSLESLLSKIKELEERSGDFVVLPGCDYAIPTSLTSLKLVRSGSCLMDDFYYSSAYPQMKCAPVLNMNILNNPYTNVNWQSDTGAFPILTKITLQNIKYLTKVSSLTLAGLELSDDDIYIFQSLTNLTSLTIINSRQCLIVTETVNGYNQNVKKPNTTNQYIFGTPTITHLNWITGLKNLQTLVLVGCKNLSDISALKDLPNLKELDIRETAVKNTDFLTSSQLKITK
jgi:hypothetical protein